MSADFCHLHLHTQYSFLDGAIRINDLFPKVQSLGMDAVAITDHGNMFGAADFYMQAKKAGVKPILGMEAYVAGSKGRKDRSVREAYHLVLLAENQTGYQNLVQLASKAYLEGFYYVPRIDTELLREHHEGIIALSACMSGVVARPYLRGEVDQARRIAKEYKDIFGRENFFLEVQANGMEAQHRVNNFMIELAGDLGLPLIATNDCHYLEREHAEAQDLLMCIRQKKNFDDPQRHRHEVDAYYVRSAEEMRGLLGPHLAQACDNSLSIAQRCKVELDIGHTYLPAFPVPDNYQNIDDYTRDLAHAGLKTRFSEMKSPPKDEKEYWDRLEFELGIIIKMGFPGYFLIVQDFINEAKKRGIRVGPGRGSGAGSLVAYSLRITDIDPLPYNLLFERFLNPERKSMPDFDVDFMQERRGEVIEYVAERYGRDHVAQIATYGGMNAKTAIKDVARTLCVIPYGEINALTKLIPDLIDGKKVSLSKAMEIEPKIHAMMEDNPIFKRVIDIAKVLEGLYRQAGMHAAGVVIGDKPITSYTPVFKGKNGEIISQFDKYKVEECGLVKFDFLGLKTLDVIAAAEAHVNVRIERENKADGEALEAFAKAHPHIKDQRQAAEPIARLDCSLLTYDAPEVYERMCLGETMGMFQLESSGFQDLMKRIKPDGFEDVIASVALYRPGPIQAGMVDDYVKRKHGLAKVSYPHSWLKEILQPTYGTILYQEQVMQIAQVLSGYSLGRADVLRRAMGKKNAKIMAEQRQGFVDGAIAKKVDGKLAGEIFDLVEKFAGYGFNKSHSAAYAAITYQTGYLKVFYPAEFLAAMLTTESGSTNDVVKYIAEARRIGIEVLPPDVNSSQRSFTVERNAEGTQQIRFGLSAVKGLGDAALQAIITEREAGGPFLSLFELCERVPLQRINKTVLAALAHSGALDGFGRPRAQLEMAIERAIEAAQPLQKAKAIGQGSLFSMFSTPNKSDKNDKNLQAVGSAERYDEDQQEWPERERLRLEKNALGFYLTGHPLFAYRDDLGRLASTRAADLEKSKTREEISIAGIVANIDERSKKDGSGHWATVTLEDLSGTCTVQVFTRVYGECVDLLKSDAPVWIRGRVQREEDREEVRLRAEEVLSLDQLRIERTQAIWLKVPSELEDPKGKLEDLLKTLQRHQGATPVRVEVIKTGHSRTLLEIGTPRVSADPELKDELHRLFGADAVRFS